MVGRNRTRRGALAPHGGEAEWHQSPPVQPQEGQPQQRQPQYGQEPYRHNQPHQPYKKRKSFFSELFDD